MSFIIIIKSWKGFSLVYLKRNLSVTDDSWLSTETHLLEYNKAKSHLHAHISKAASVFSASWAAAL